MTHEERANWIRRGIILFIAIGVLLGVWFYPEKKPEPKQVAASQEQAKHLIEVLHFHLPGDPDSEKLADSFNKVETKYSGLVLVTRIDVQKEPERAKAEKVTKPPKVVMMAGEVRACKFQGLWTQAQIELKIDEILHGLERMGKDWRPDVKGMQSATPTAAAKVAPPTQPAAPSRPAAAAAQSPVTTAPATVQTTTPAAAKPGGPPPGMSRTGNPP